MSTNTRIEIANKDFKPCHLDVNPLSLTLVKLPDF